MYKVRKKIKEFTDYDLVSFSVEPCLKSEKVHKPFLVAGEVKRVNIITGELTDYSRSDIVKSRNNSINRTLKNFIDIYKSNINDWQFFGTLTFDSKKVDRYNDNLVIDSFRKWRQNIKKQYPQIKYIAVPERHKDLAMHFHILLGCMSKSDLKLVELKRKDKSGRTIYRCDSFKYGRTNFSEISDKEKTMNYCKQYIQKNLDSSVEKGKKRFYYSKNCTKPNIISELLDYDFKSIPNVERIANYEYPTNDYTIENYYLDTERNYIIKKLNKNISNIFKDV